MIYASALLLVHTLIWVFLGSKECSVATVTAFLFPFNFSHLFMLIEMLVYWNLVYSVKIRMSALNEQIKPSLTHLRKIVKAYLYLVPAKDSVNECYGLTILVINLL
ncbi:hypothetical protein Zmor_017033 [Zophobas morio]|uniref:Gustatory receptor n=1 Tax=Zophobas morio TaxID=2755281 RepID=A0AA38MCD0_9CUCU|nr:hypothetical protein Zmor_017033 [Zophobas morio]